MPLPAADSAQLPFLRRFSMAERWLHRVLGLLMLGCIVTALAMYQGPLTSVVGHRRLVELAHVWCGYAIPVPLLLALFSAAYRADLRRLNRFTAGDWSWLRPGAARRRSLEVGKFNAGQKLNSSLTGGAILVLLGTGTLMFFTHLVRLSWRTGATFVHDWTALALGLLVAGHVYRAATDPEARRGMRTGIVSRAWALGNHSAWVAEVEDADESPG
jgi:formate dehydrogenase subunit gamma